MMKLFDMPIESASKWKFLLAKLFGKKIFEKDGWVFRHWRGKYWISNS